MYFWIVVLIICVEVAIGIYADEKDHWGLGFALFVLALFTLVFAIVAAPSFE